jgi:uncharacterized protein Smg (DUF494 family)
MFVIGEIQSRRIKMDEIEGFSDELVQRGYSQRDVATAISLVADRFTSETRRTQVGNPSNTGAHRVLHDIERQYVTPEAHGYLLQMVHLGILDFNDLEEILEHCMLLGNLNVGGDEMKMLVATHLLEKDPQQSESTYIISPYRSWPEHVH